MLLSTQEGKTVKVWVAGGTRKVWASNRTGEETGSVGERKASIPALPAVLMEDIEISWPRFAIA